MSKRKTEKEAEAEPPAVGFDMMVGEILDVVADGVEKQWAEELAYAYVVLESMVPASGVAAV